MPYLPTAQVFLEQSELLISARPTTTRITTKYNIPNPNPSPSIYKPSSQRPPKPRISKKPTKASETAPSTTTGTDQSATVTITKPRPRNLQATLTLKTYDPESGTCLKYRTDKAAEVGRLIGALASCARIMAGVKATEPSTEITGAPDAQEMQGVMNTGATSTASKVKAQAQNSGGKAEGGAGAGGGGGGKKKKKGKK